jgi:RNA-directed DNA polymerase
MVKSAKAAQRVMVSVTRYVEKKLKLTVNRLKSECARLSECAFLGFKVGYRGKIQWTENQVFEKAPHPLPCFRKGQSAESVQGAGEATGAKRR